MTEKSAVELSGADLGRTITVDVLGTSFTGTLNSVSHYPTLGTSVGMVVDRPGGHHQFDATLQADTMVRLSG